MKKPLLLMLMSMLTILSAHAQSKVFKEVSDEISSQVSVILQDNTLVGYLVFARLEKVNEDSFNYRVTIMDENLNDIGTVNFRETNIYLMGVAFEQDVLCLGYFKSNMVGKTFPSYKEYQKQSENGKHAVMLQFLGLDGKIIAQNNLAIKVNMEAYNTLKRREVMVTGTPKHLLQLINVPQHGFACFYGDTEKNTLAVFKTNGAQLWQKRIVSEPANANLLASGSSLYFITKDKSSTGKSSYSYEVQSFGVPDSTVYPGYTLKDKQGHYLSLLTFENNPATGKPYLSGSLVTSPYGYSPVTIAHGYHAGLFTINFEGHEKKDIKESFSYWDDNSQPSISRKGYYRDLKLYGEIRTAFKDYAGNNYFLANSFKKRTRFGVIVSSVILAPLLIYSPLILYVCGTRKAKLGDPILIKQDFKGNISYESTVKTKGNKFNRANYPMSLIGFRSFNTAVNNESKKHYLIINDGVNTNIYDVTSKKVTRTIPAKDGQTVTSIFPAKEGHVLVSEQNKKEKYTRISIESL